MISGDLDMVDVPDNPSLADAIRSMAAQRGLDPIDVATAVSYETKGTFNPEIWGGAGNKYFGLMQASPDNQRRYKVGPGVSGAEQVTALGDYLRDRGVKPGMGLLDIYSAINAGRPGLYNASDANNGGAPGTVADKVRGMAAHRMRASLLLDGKLPDMQAAGAALPAPKYSAPDTPVAAGGPRLGNAPLSLAPESLTPNPADAQFAQMLEAARGIAQQAHEGDEAPEMPPFQFENMMRMPGFGRRRA